MSVNTLNVRIRNAIRTEAEWTNTNPILYDGEIAYSSNKNGMFKVGDGTSKWSELSYNTANTLSGLTTTIAELNYVKGVTSNIQTQLNSKSSSSHTHNYLPLSGGTLTGTLNSSKSTSTYLAGNQGATIINSTATAGSYTMLAKMNSTNGYFTHGTFRTKYLLQYTSKTIVDAETNTVTKSATLLDESGNSSFPGTITAPTFSGSGASLTSLNASNISSGTLNSSRLPTVPVSKGGTGLTTLTLGQVLIGNGTNNVTFKAIDTTTGGTTGSTSLITSGAVYAGLAKKADTHTHPYLPLTGGTMTGNISFNMNSSTQIPLKVYGGDENGQGISVGAGGATIVGSGKSSKACESLLEATTEELWLTSDSTIKFWTNCNTIANKAGVYLDATRQFYPNLNNSGSIGTSSYKWANVYATTLHGALDGNANTATALTTSGGSATQPIYFSGGKPLPCTYTLGKSVPSNAVFTDTKVTQTLATTSASYPVLLAPTGQTTTTTTGSYFAPDLTYNPVTGVLTVNAIKIGEGVLRYDTSKSAIVVTFE